MSRWSVDDRSARAMLSEIAHLRAHGRRRLASVWFPLSVFALIYLGMAPLALLVGRDHLAPYFVAALVLGSVATVRHYRQRVDADGVETSLWPWLATSILMTIGGGVASRAGFQMHSQALDTIGPFLVVSAFVLGFGLWTRSPLLIACGLALTFASAASVPLATGDKRVALQAGAFAAILLATAHIQRHRELIT
jgi:hypothetical protein